MLCLIAGCSKEPAEPASAAPLLATAGELGQQLILPNSEHLASTEFASVDLAWGERLTGQCRACHGLEAGTVNMIGPTLHGIFGSKVGSVAGFDYSPALAESDFKWTPRALDAWLAQPASFLPGNRMTFAGLSKADDRRAVIAYLLQVTDDSSATPD